MRVKRHVKFQIGSAIFISNKLISAFWVNECRIIYGHKCYYPL